MKTYGLLGFPLSHSFSQKFFEEFFKSRKLPYKYHLFEYHNIVDFFNEIDIHQALLGFNITIPHKETIIPYLDELIDEAKDIKVVNCVKVVSNKLIGYNTDVFGFEMLMRNVFVKNKTALILGTGGAAKAVAYVLSKQNYHFEFVTSKHAREGMLTYESLWQVKMHDYSLIINTTHLGMYPEVDEFPKIPYGRLTSRHTLIDLVYNPQKTEFLYRGEKQGATILNGLEMLEQQALSSWEIWEK